MKKARTILWLSIITALSIASTVAILRSQPPRFEDRFHRVVSISQPDFPAVDEYLAIDNDTLLYYVNDQNGGFERLSLSRRAIVRDDRLNSAVGHPLGWLSMSNDSKWLLATYELGGKTVPVRTFSMVDGHVVSIYQSPQVIRQNTWLPDNRHWAEFRPTYMMVHDILRPDVTTRVPINMPCLHPANYQNPDGTWALHDPDFNHFDSDYSGASQDGKRIIVDGALIDLTTNPITGAHAVNLPSGTFKSPPRDSFFAVRPPLEFRSCSICEDRQLVAYMMYDSGQYRRKSWMPSWFPMSTQPSTWICICDFSGHHAHLFAVLSHKVNISPSMTWSPDGRKLLVEDNGSIWEANVD